MNTAVYWQNEGKVQGKRDQGRDKTLYVKWDGENKGLLREDWVWYTELSVLYGCLYRMKRC